MEDDDRLDEIFAALTSRRRRTIVRTLALRPASIGQLAREQGSSLPAIHRHIAALEEAGLVHRKKSGRTTFLALTRSGLMTAQDWLGQFSAHWGGTAEESLDNYIAAIAADPATKESDP